MKDTRKLNDALGGVDERFIEEAAEYGKRTLPGWVKYGAVAAAGAAAVAAVCIFAGQGSGGVDLIAQSGSQGELSAADITSAGEPASAEELKYSSLYECWSAGLTFSPDGTFTLFPCEPIDSTPTGTYTVSGEFVTLSFTQLEDVKYRGRLSDDGREITMLEPDERLYAWVLLADSGAERIISENGGEYPDIVFTLSDGSILGAGTAEAVESAEAEQEAYSEEMKYSPEEANEFIKSLLTEDGREADLTERVRQLQEISDDRQEQLDALREKAGSAGTAEAEEVSSLIEQISAEQGELNAEITDAETQLQQLRSERLERIYAAISAGKGPLTADGVTVTVQNGYDEWTGGYHYGVDLACPGMSESTEITAFMDGTVIKAAEGGWNHGMGSYIVIDHGDGAATVYASLGSVEVSEGQQVSAGDVIAHAGMSGWSTGVHLHFEIRENGEIIPVMSSYPKVPELGWVVG